MSSLRERILAHLETVSADPDRSLLHATSAEIGKAAEEALAGPGRARALGLDEAWGVDAGGPDSDDGPAPTGIGSLDDLDSAADEPLGPPPTGIGPPEDGGDDVDDQDLVELGARAIESIRGGATPTDAELRLAAAIILPRERPAVFVVEDAYEAPPPPNEGLVDKLPLLGPRIRAIGRLRANSAPYGDVAGTGFVVGPDLLMTNRHVANYFVSGAGVDGLAFKPGEDPGCDLKAEHGSPAELLLELTGPVLMHPYWDVALVRVAGAPLAGIEPLTLRAERPVGLVGSDVAVIGYPVKQYLSDRRLRDLRSDIFGDAFGVKRLMPGKLLDRSETTTQRPGGGERAVAALGHDASTLAGNSGSAVIDLESGDVLGVHFKGLALEANFAVPAWELARDPRVRDLGVELSAGDPEPVQAGVEAAWQEI